LSESELSELKTLREKIDMISEKNWIQKAVKHPGRCANPGDKNCPKGSPQYNLAMRFKKGDIHKANVSEEENDFARTNQYDPKIQEAGGGAVQHSSYRTQGKPDHGNLPQDPKTRWANDLDEGQSKVSKTIAKGQKSKTSTKVQNLKHQKPKKTSSGVHKRKT
jgi:hypothetical protein